MNPKWNPRELFGIDPQAKSPFTCIGIAKSKLRHPRCRNPIEREKRAQASKLLDNMSKLAVSGEDYNERDVKKKIQELHKEVLCWRHREGGTHPQCNEMEREWWEKLRSAQAQHNAQVIPPQLRPEFSGLFRRYKDGGLVRAVVPLQAQARAPMAQPVPQHMNGNPNPEELANRVRILEQEEAETREAEQGLQVRLFALAWRRGDTLRERAAISREVEEVARRVEEDGWVQAAQADRLVEENRRREEAARRAEEERRAQIATRLVEAERQRYEAARRAEEEILIQTEQRRRYEEIIRQQRERAQRELDEQMRIDQALAQQLEEEEQRQEAERQEAERQEAQRREQGLRRIQNRVARMQRFALLPLPSPSPQPQPQRNLEIAAPPVQIHIQRAAEPHIVRRKPLEECFACLEPIRALEDAEWCRAQCGQNICNGCFELWHTNQLVGVLLRCGICRAIWKWEVGGF